MSWTSDLADTPENYGVSNVYGDVGQLFAQSVVAEPRLGAALMGILVKGLGADHICWGTDAIWTGSPQWQIEALRRLEIPEDMQKRYGFAPPGGPTGAVKAAIFSGNNMRLYGLTKRTDLGDRVAAMKAQSITNGAARSNLRYGYARRAPAPPEGSVGDRRRFKGRPSARTAGSGPPDGDGRAMGRSSLSPLLPPPPPTAGSAPAPSRHP